ncbi:hypothetical protein HK101_004585 [Irineochytrium annulatum]|nr:hypothetical protein HK101_004585 [Irineochytrium annulatum]
MTPPRSRRRPLSSPTLDTQLIKPFNRIDSPKSASSCSSDSPDATDTASSYLLPNSATLRQLLEFPRRTPEPSRSTPTLPPTWNPDDDDFFRSPVATPTGRRPSIRNLDLNPRRSSRSSLRVSFNRDAAASADGRAPMTASPTDVRAPPLPDPTSGPVVRVSSGRWVDVATGVLVDPAMLNAGKPLRRSASDGASSRGLTFSSLGSRRALSMLWTGPWTGGWGGEAADGNKAEDFGGVEDDTSSVGSVKSLQWVAHGAGSQGCTLRVVNPDEDVRVVDTVDLIDGSPRGPRLNLDEWDRFLVKDVRDEEDLGDDDSGRVVTVKRVDSGTGPSLHRTDSSLSVSRASGSRAGRTCSTVPVTPASTGMAVGSRGWMRGSIKYFDPLSDLTVAAEAVAESSTCDGLANVGCDARRVSVYEEDLCLGSGVASSDLSAGTGCSAGSARGGTAGRRPMRIGRVKSWDSLWKGIGRKEGKEELPRAGVDALEATPSLASSSASSMSSGRSGWRGALRKVRSVVKL